MDVRPLKFEGVWELTPRTFRDNRGEFTEGFVQHKLLAATGQNFTVAQLNISTSIKGTIRGIHFSQLPPGQAKYVQCTAGEIIDFIVDVRPDSPTFGQWDSLTLDSSRHNAVHIPSGFGHAFQALSESATVVYLCDSPYSPETELGINPLDADIALEFPITAHILSDKDLQAPSLASINQTLLPRISPVDNNLVEDSQRP